MRICNLFCRRILDLWILAIIEVYQPLSGLLCPHQPEVAPFSLTETGPTSVWI